MKKRILTCALAIFFLLCALTSCVPHRRDVLFVTVLDVGQGDSVLVSLGEHHLLIDTGSAASRDLLLGELDRLGVEALDAILITHPHEDHYGNVRMLLETRSVGALFVSKTESDEFGYLLLLEIAATRGVEVRSLGDGESFLHNGVVCEVFCPIPDAPEPNDAGLVVRARYGECKLLFMGDAEQAAEQALLARSVSWKCDFLKVGHHGSTSSSSRAFLQAAAPQIAAISCAMDNDYGFPHGEVLEGLADVGAAIYRTDEQGTLRFMCDGTGITYEK